jgi:hypothetical protein
MPDPREEAARKAAEKANAIARRMRAAPQAAVEPKEEAVSAARREVEAGKGEGVPKSEFTRAERSQSDAPVPTGVPRARWIYAMIEQGAKPQEVIARAEERLRRSPTKANLLLMQGLLNEFGRQKRPPVRVSELVRQQRVNALLAKE